MLYLTCTTITSVDLAHYGVSRVKDWVSGDCGTRDVNMSQEMNRQLNVRCLQAHAEQCFDLVYLFCSYLSYLLRIRPNSDTLRLSKA